VNVAIADASPVARPTGRNIALSLGEWAVSRTEGDVLVCHGLGSCVGITMYDRVAKVAGMAHAVLPDSRAGRASEESAKFVDLAVPLMLREMLAAGAQKHRLDVALVGGAQVLQTSGPLAGIGDRNAEAARAALLAVSMRPRREALGGKRGRTARLEVATGRILVAHAGEPEVEL
jgi:chemotaxis protein CheD